MIRVNMRTFYTGVALLLLLINTYGVFAAEVSFFGDEINEGRDDQLVEQFEYGISDSRVTTTVTLGGAVTVLNSMAVVSAGGLLGGTASIQSKRYVRYQPARQVFATFSVKFTAGVTGAVQAMGLYDSDDGFAVGYNGTQFALLYRNSVTGATVDTVVAQQNFNIDKLNGTGPSGITLDPTSLNIYRISYSWLGGEPIMYEVMNSIGVFIPFHVIIVANASSNPPLSAPQLPMRAEIVHGLVSTPISLSTAGWSAGIIEGGRSPVNSRIFIVSNTLASLSILSGEVNLITIQNPTTVAGKTNKVEARLCFVGGGSMDTTGVAVALRFILNASLLLPVYTQVSVGNSIMNVTTTGAYMAGTGTDMVYLPNTKYGSGPTVRYFDVRDNVMDFILLPGDSLTITADVVTTSTTAPIIGVLGWDERY